MLALLGTAGCADASRLMPVLRAAVHATHGATALARAPLAQPAAAAPAAHRQNAGPAAAAAASLSAQAIDMNGVLRAAVRLPQDVRRLHDIIVTTLVTITILGLANIALMLTVLGRLNRAASEAEAALLRPASAPQPTAQTVPPPLPTPEVVAVGPESILKLAAVGMSTARVCACGAAISLRSRTGRCRACARLATTRAKRSAAGLDIPIPKTTAQLTS